jgi:predicted Zn-dependent peptidase
MPREIQTHIFPNGFRLIHETPSNKLGICALHVFVNFGSAYENDETRGMAHFIEHMCFKGTKHIPNPLNIFKRQDNIGGVFNAYTYQRYTVYVSKLNNDEIEHCVDLFAEMMLHSSFPANPLKKEEHVVIEECLRSEDDGASVLENNNTVILFEGSSFQYPIDHISYHKKLYQHKSVVDLYRLFYRPENMVMSIVTEIPFHTILKMVEKSQYTNNRPLTKSDQLRLRKHGLYFTTNQPYGNIRYNLHNKKNTETTHASISFTTCNQESDDKYTFEILKHILSGTFGNKLFILLREENGLTYTSACLAEYNEYSGVITIYAQVNKKKVIKNGSAPGLVPLLIGFLNDLIKYGVTTEELNIAKKNKKSKLKLELESLENQARHNGREWLIYGNADEIVPIKNYYDVYFKSITRKQVHDVIKKYIKKESMVVCMVGPDLPSEKTVDRECRKLII